ncbi:30S ribosome-binding factor RbfA [Amantichitinum ursilacus]|uniref:Ribosome-binding factor A n=1 Tax=Amantichitinum ursilacus TaxID=857265 RepID=A0A0N0GNL6_9NEIS|nr:30S ribosome-binding factor RbfA [Amantichitinum ursilacus]KPC52952.1 Ribosome-binding factor A [Amantichitinum ursilacus]
MAKQAKHFSRSDRVAQQLQRDTAELIRAELDHPKASLITITDVEVTRDYSHAKIFYTFLGTPEDAKSIAEKLEAAKGFIRSQLARGISLFKMPELHFEYDHSVERGMALDSLIQQAVSTSAPLDDDEAAAGDHDADAEPKQEG